MKDLVFIVEDNLVQQKMLQAHFEEVLGNYSVKTFLTPVDLVKALKLKPFAVVLDHFFLPGGETGLHYLKEVKKQYPLVPVIYHTTLDDNAVREEVMALGAEQYILKDTTSLVRLRTALDTIHDKILKKKSFWQTWFLDYFEV
jgi:CheY-like chemotaxis protein